MHDMNFKASMHQWLHLGSCWSIDTVETHEKKGRVDIYISHSGKDLVCQIRVSLVPCMTIVRSVNGAIWISFISSVLFTVGFPVY